MGVLAKHRPLTEKQWAILAYLRSVLPEHEPTCEEISEATGFTHGVSFTLQSLRFRGLVALGKVGGAMVVIAVSAE